VIDPARAVEVLRNAGITLFTGVPDSLLAELTAVVDATLPSSVHLPASSEGAAVAVAAGHHLATGEVALVYLQNSGLGNAVNPLASLTSNDVYGIPLVLLVGWRGEPGDPDEPQHVHQGRITEELLSLLDVPVVRLTAHSEDWELLLESAVERSRSRQAPVAILVSAGTFSPAAARSVGEGGASLRRAEAIGMILDAMSAARFVATTGYTARELASLRVSRGEKDEADFLVVGSMGHAVAIALGVAQGSPDVRVICLDGDGSVGMHMGSLAMAGRAAPENLGHVVLNNRVHESVGGQPTVLDGVRIVDVAEASGYRSVHRCASREELTDALAGLDEAKGPWLLEIVVGQGTLDGLPRPSDLKARKARFMARTPDD
jgi:phosphonopyruvate decarboxylase